LRIWNKLFPTSNQITIGSKSGEWNWPAVCVLWNENRKKSNIIHFKWSILLEVDCSILIDFYLHVMAALFIANFWNLRLLFMDWIWFVVRLLIFQSRHFCLDSWLGFTNSKFVLTVNLMESWCLDNCFWLMMMIFFTKKCAWVKFVDGDYTNLELYLKWINWKYGFSFCCWSSGCFMLLYSVSL
jgi:hypothetical protein